MMAAFLIGAFGALILLTGLPAGWEWAALLGLIVGLLSIYVENRIDAYEL